MQKNKAIKINHFNCAGVYIHVLVFTTVSYCSGVLTKKSIYDAFCVIAAWQTKCNQNLDRKCVCFSCFSFCWWCQTDNIEHGCRRLGHSDFDFCFIWSSITCRKWSDVKSRLGHFHKSFYFIKRRYIVIRLRYITSYI